MIILVTQTGCSFVVSAAGSLIGNLGAEYIEEIYEKNKETKTKNNKEENEEA